MEDTVENKKDNTTKLFKLLKHLNRGTQASNNEAIKKGKYFSTPKKIAENC